MKRDALVNAAKSAAAAAGINLSAFPHTLAVVTGATDVGNTGSDVAMGLSNITGQPSWRWCKKCQGMYYAGFGACAGGPIHNVFSSADYSLTNSYDAASAQPGWDGTRAPGPCPAGGTHDHSQSGFYRPPEFRGEVTEVLANDLQPGQSFTTPSGNVTFQVFSFVSAGAEIQVTVA